MKVLKNFFYNMTYQVLLIILPLVTMPYVSRVLGPDGLGKYSYTNSIMSYFVLLGSLGISLYGSRQVAYVQDSKENRSKVFWDVAILKIVTTVISILLLAFFLTIYNEYTSLIIAQSLTLVANMFDVSWYFIGIEDFKKTITRNVAVKIISLALIFSLVHTKSDLTIYILIITGSTLIGNFILIPFLKGQIYFVDVNKLHFSKHVMPILLLFIPQLATQIYLVVNKTMLGQMDSIKSVGFFSSSDTLVRLALTIVSSISAVLMPRIANLLAKGDKKGVNHYMDKSFQFINFLSFPLVLGLIAISSKFVPLFLGKGFGVVSNLIILESPIIILISWSIAITNQYLIPSGLNKEYIGSTFAGAISNIILNLLFIRNYGVYGAIISTLISELIVLAYLLFGIKNKLNVKKMLFSNIHKYLFSSLVMFLIIILVDIWLPKTICAVILEITLGIIVYIIALFFVKADILLKWEVFFD
ncbi:hypothetical protein GCM10025878_08680 [Leuconostoc gasicomitatum]|uniref:flippase n=1 Tax=Leuconostoc TaxID=1243 RepID=UPI0001DB5B9D|nr:MULTISPECIES: flippase [Leuconostoc]MBZ5952765.1 flippase [Leuconostoc gasicomitatum]MBZ6008536.1 flippase [Leuconostoc gelidum subsp. aenigmaticum]CBL91357.1 Polysaccharide Transporter [Leuconostoc gasicomitatum LMG 18811]CUW08564.1 Membrane protein involved in the export of O-antigen, teichoic acid lipoteichoic acids [Leuconostoc inhae]CUW12210.1 Membrane protein involved in the export of O-antigen, teichoic acid lipoteichoic acids [Leuconostoc inhae]